MFKRTVFLIVAGILPILMYSQNEMCKSLKEFSSYFSNHDSVFHVNCKGRRIPNEIIENITKKSIDNSDIQIYAVSKLNRENSNIFITEVSYPIGGYSFTYWIYLFTQDCELKKHLRIGNKNGSLYRDGNCDIRRLNDSVIEIKEYEIETEGVKTYYSDTSYDYFYFSNHDIYSINKSKPSKQRKYKYSSKRVLEDSEISKLSNDELDIMRNEIFADYGYIFKSEKWKSYFEDKEWYNAKNENVVDSLTLIEKINIEKILKLAPMGN